MRWSCAGFGFLCGLGVVGVAGVVSVLGPTASADPADLEGGVFIVHHPPGFQYSPGVDWCEKYDELYAISSCEEQNPRIDLDGNLGERSVWYVIAAWSEAKTWCGTEFGLGSFDPQIYTLLDYGACLTNALENSTGGWPGPNQGTAVVATDVQWDGNFQAVYYFSGYAYYQGQIPLGADPAQTFGGFGNCATPAETWAAADYGAMGLFTDGTYACPGGGGLDSGSEGDDFAGDDSYPEDPDAVEPDPCPEGGEGDGAMPDVDGVCCFETECEASTQEDCYLQDGDFYAGYLSCDPNPCPDLLEELFCEVSPDGSGDYETIQEAIDAGCDNIALTNGVFFGDGNRDIDFRGRDIVIHSASGQAESCSLNCEGSSREPHRGFIFQTGETPQAKVQGITITNGYGSSVLGDPAWT